MFQVRLRGMWVGLLALHCALTPGTGFAFFEDICLSSAEKGIVECIQPTKDCKINTSVNAACPAQLAESVNMLISHVPGRSMIHADATYFIAQALGYRSDVAYWIAAYNEVTDLTMYAPIDQCGGVATSKNSGKHFITAKFNGFERTNIKTDGPLYHYVLSFSPNGDGTDVHGAGGVQAVYPFHYPVSQLVSGYPNSLDDVYQGTLYNLRQWAMQAGNQPGLLCAAGLTEQNGLSHFSGPKCLTNIPIRGTVPLLSGFRFGSKIEAHSGQKILDNSKREMTYDVLDSWLKDRKRTTGVLWKDPESPPVPVQLVRLGIYLHTLQDTSSHSTYCGDDAPSPPGGKDPGTYMVLGADKVRLVFGTSCASIPHLAGHLQETGTGSEHLPLRDYTALNMTLNELVIFGNTVAKAKGWIINPELLPPDLSGGKNQQGKSASDLEAELVGTIVTGRAWTRGEVYRSGIVTLPLQQIKAADRLRAMNAALGTYSSQVRKQSSNPEQFKGLELMPGNASDPHSSGVCFK